MLVGEADINLIYSEINKIISKYPKCYERNTQGAEIENERLGRKASLCSRS